MKNILTDINLNFNEIRKPVFEKISGTASTFSEAYFYYDTTDEKLKYRDSSSWKTPAIILSDLEDVDVPSLNVGDRLEWNGSNWVLTNSAFSVSDLLDVAPTQSQTISTSGGGNPTTYVDIDWGDQILLGAGYTHSTTTNPEEITVQGDGIYEISYSISTNQVATTSRTVTNIRLVLDTGSGFTPIDRSSGAIYNRTAAAGEGTVTKTLKLSLSDGDIIKVQCRRLSGNGSIITIFQGCNITITKLT